MFRLSSKIILAFSIIIITGSILMVSIINHTTRSGYETFIHGNDRVMADGLALTLTDFYARSKSWAGVDKFLQMPKNEGAMGRGRRNSIFIPIILTDANGNVLIDSQGRNKKTRKSDHGIPIRFKGQIVGHIYVGTMIEAGLSMEEEHFLGRIKMIIIVVSAFILTISIIFTYIFSRKITEPISELSAATKDIEAGDYSRRVETDGRDEISKLSKSFNNMANSIESSDKWRKQIIADSAHELRTPVTLIQGNLELILEGVYEADKPHLESIYNETLVLSRLIKELQELSSAESGTMNLNMENINLNELIDNTIEIFKPEEIKENIKLTNQIQKNLPITNGDFQKLKQVFSNILANAFRHTPSDGNIKIESQILKDSVVISISDTGSGIPKDELEKVFERFYRTDSSRNRISGGSGLGLSISREIIKLHSGTIHAKSQENQGTTIIISLPYVASQI